MTQFELLAKDIVKHLRSDDPAKKAKGKAALMMVQPPVLILVKKLMEEESV